MTSGFLQRRSLLRFWLVRLAVLMALNFARVFGLPYRIFVCLIGLIITLLSVTGVCIWWMKRRGRVASQLQAGAATLQTQEA